MQANEARKIIELKKAKVAVSRFFPLIKKAAENNENQIYVDKHKITQVERELLSNEYGYRIEREDDGDYHSSKIVGYYIKW